MSSSSTYLTSLQTKFPVHSGLIEEITGLQQRRLWHQLTIKVDDLLRSPELKDEAASFYKNFLAEIEAKLSPVRCAAFATRAAEAITDAKDRLAFLEDVLSRVADKKREYLATSRDAAMLLRSECALAKLHAGDPVTCKKDLDSLYADLEGVAGVEAQVHASVYRTTAEYWRTGRPNPGEFYRSGLLFLAYTPTETLAEDDQVQWAFDLGVSALLGDDVYNMGELLMHPVFEALTADKKHGWMSKVLSAFNAGRVGDFNSLVKANSTQFKAISELASSTSKLDAKIRILGLIDTLFRKTSDSRVVHFDEIAAATSLQGVDVEMLLMRCMSLGLVRGTIDQVASTFTVTWVQPRVLDRVQIDAMVNRIGAWKAQVDNVSSLLAQNGGELLRT